MIAGVAPGISMRSCSGRSTTRLRRRAPGARTGTRLVRRYTVCPMYASLRSVRRTVIGYQRPPEKAGMPASFSSFDTAEKLRLSA